MPYDDEIELHMEHHFYGKCTGSNLEYSLCLRPLSDLTDIEWAEIFSLGLLKFPEVVSGVELRIHNSSDVVRLYDANAGFTLTTPKRTIVSFTKTTKQFSSIYKFDQVLAFDKMFELKTDLYGLIDGKTVLNLNDIEHGNK